MFKGSEAKFHDFFCVCPGKTDESKTTVGRRYYSKTLIPPTHFSLSFIRRISCLLAREALLLQDPLAWQARCPLCQPIRANRNPLSITSCIAGPEGERRQQSEDNGPFHICSLPQFVTLLSSPLNGLFILPSAVVPVLSQIFCFFPYYFPLNPILVPVYSGLLKHAICMTFVFHLEQKKLRVHNKNVYSDWWLLLHFWSFVI